MSFPSQIPLSVVGVIAADPAADQVYPLWRVPAACEITGIYFTTADDVSASTANYFSITPRNGGAAGTATTALGAAVGGTAGWTGLTPVSSTVVAAQKNPSAGDVITASYDETGTGTLAPTLFQIEYKIGT